MAKYVYNEPAYYQILVGGSNIGELLGALAVFLLSERVKSPVPWIRLDAVMLLGVWGVVMWRPPVCVPYVRVFWLRGLMWYTGE